MMGKGMMGEGDTGYGGFEGICFSNSKKQNTVHHA
jgi:hypothetical protein